MDILSLLVGFVYGLGTMFSVFFFSTTEDRKPELSWNWFGTMAVCVGVFGLLWPFFLITVAIVEICDRIADRQMDRLLDGLLEEDSCLLEK